MITNKTKKLYIKGTGARDTKTFDKMQVINKTLTYGKFDPIGGGTAFKKGGTAFKNPVARSWAYCV